jgi:exonuclease SbcC
MIPQRIRIQGFLCYKEEQIIDFQGSTSLWMLSGHNGSGKSAIFDAVTFALFGKHRGGATGNVELINKDSNQLLVEFDFLLNGHLCRIKRTQKRDNKGGARGTQQLFHWVEGDFQPLPDTTNKGDFDHWIAENIGLTYETFTSSVLLLQGKAEKLLDSGPKERREVLAGIVHLERYERLHAKADDRRKALESEVKGLNARLAALPEVDPLELGAVRLAIDEQKNKRNDARAEVERLQQFQAQAASWRELRGRLHQSQSRYQQAKQTLAEEARIEKAVERLRELRQVVPLLQEISINRHQLAQVSSDILTLNSQAEQKRVALLERQAAYHRTEQNRRTLLANQDNQVRRQTEVGERLRVLAVQVRALEAVELEERELAQLQQQLARLPADAPQRAAAARETLAALEALDRLLPQLERFASLRTELRDCRQRLLDARKHLDEVQVRRQSLRLQAEQARARKAATEAAKIEAAERATEARTRYRAAKADLDELSKLDGARVCRQCGQSLTPGHIEEEKHRRGQILAETEVEGRRLRAALDAAQLADEQASEALHQSDEAYQQARDAYLDHKSKVENSEREWHRISKECSSVYALLPSEQSKRIASHPGDDWAQTTWPGAADLDSLRAEVRSLAAARRARDEAESQVRQKESLTQEQERCSLRLEKHLLGLPADRQALRRDHSSLEAEHLSLSRQIDANRAAIGQVEAEVQKAHQARETAQQEANRILQNKQSAELKKKNFESEIKRLTKSLPEAWQVQAETVGIGQLSQWQGELRALEADGTDDKARELEYFRANVDRIQQEVADLERQESTYPDTVRQPAEVIAALLEQARAEQDRIEEELTQSRQRLALLEDHAQQRESLSSEIKSRESTLKIARTLAELLGRERLQLYLVRQAERQVVEYANAVLDRLSGGQLCLQLSGEAGGEGLNSKALTLEVFNRATGEQPINVAFLSGSQKFRVAVSLALGIGQYASAQQRPIESVIIDEGFGCLDNQGRQVMIQELQNLRSQMKCILLVSHQEDFAEAFADGYQFRLEEGATKVTRFQR